MKNPFIKSNNSGVWIATLVLSAIAAGAITYYYKKNGSSAITEEVNEHATDYLKAKAPKKRKQKTDLHDLQSIVG
jgi:hypothetical protein